MSVYLQHFSLNREPFSIVPDPGFLYPSHRHRQAVAHLKYGLDREGGFILLSGEVGTGKTTLTRTLLNQLPAHVRVAYVLNSKLEVTDVLASLCHELSVVLPDKRDLSLAKTCIDALYQDLLQAHGEGNKTLVVIEEAQNLTPEVLETLRLLSNLETTSHKLLHIMLVGQPELLVLLAQPQQRQLNQRVVSRFHLLPLEKDDIAHYINHRLHRAGAERAIFDQACMGVLFRLTRGVPRLINLICHHALLAAYATGVNTVSPRLLKKASVEILGAQHSRRSKISQPMVASIAVILCLALAITAVIEQSVFTPVTDESQTSIIEDQQQNPALDERAVRHENQPQPAWLTIANPFLALFKLWSVDVDALFSEEEVFSMALAHQLRAEKITHANLFVLNSIDRPGIVWLRGDDHVLRSFLLVSMTEDRVSLLDSAAVQTMDLQQFIDSWSGVFLYLWQPPFKVGNLRVGDTDSALVAWLQDKLQYHNADYEQIISAGRYTSAIAQQVVDFQRQQDITADAVVGRQTIMRLNQQSNPSIPTLIEADGSGGDH